MSKKIKKAFAASLGLMAPITFAYENISNSVSNSVSNEAQYVESSSDRIISLCNENPNLSKLLTTEIFNKEGKKTGRIKLEALCNKHKEAYSKTIFDIKEPKKENNEHNSYYKYFTSEKEISAVKGKRYYDKHIKNINRNNRHEQNIFFTISYSPFDEAVGDYGEEKYVGCIGISRSRNHKPDLEVVVSRDYKGLGIASNALRCMIDFFNSYNFICDNDEINEIEAIIAIKNYGSIGMAKKNKFKNVGHVTDLYESNGHVADRWNLKLNRNPVLERARKKKEQSIIFSYNNAYPENQMVTFGEFFEHPRHFSRCKNDYKKIEEQISNNMESIINKSDINSLKKELYSWPIAWISEDGSNMTIAINLKKLPDEISSIIKENLNCKNEKSRIKCPNLLFKNQINNK